ncbi:MAG: hypothetical protein IJ666_08050 [Ruminococcus sp.]|nr:hypothetical protein [Ruminococcus sp.]
MSNVNSALNQLNNSVQNFESNVDVHVRNVDSSTKKIHSVVQNIHDKISEFSTNIMRGEEKQIAHENIIRLDQLIKERFGNYDAVRKTIIGVVRDFDINLVRNSTIEELSEELWITSSRYWLSYALMAVTAWVNNYPDVAQNALSECVRRDPVKSSLFFCLLNLRFGRNETARRWFSLYCKSLDPLKLQHETAIMIQAFRSGIFGTDKQLEHEVTEIINGWIRIISEKPEICEGLVQDYVSYFEKFNRNVNFSYDMISSFCANSEEVKNSCADASKYDKLISLIESINVDGTMQTSGDYKSRIDAILTNLITNYDEEEMEIKAEQEYFRLVISNDGDKQVAEEQYDEIQKLRNQNYNFGKQMVNWAIYDEETDVQVRKFGIQSTKQWFSSALEMWTARVRERCPLQYSLSIDEWQSVSNGHDLEEQRTSLNNFFKNNEFRMVYVNGLNIVLMIVFFLGLAVTAVSVVHIVKYGFTGAIFAGLVLMAGAAAALFLRIVSGKKKFAERVQKAINALEGTMSQITEFQRYFSENVAKKENILSMLAYL